jgi:putative aminopeptidase FrvX
MAAKNPLRTLATDRRRHERIALELTSLPTAAGREYRVQAYLDRWLAARSRSLVWQRDHDGNLLVNSKKRPTTRTPPLLITAHLDHPAFVVSRIIDDRTIEAEFRGGVHDPYFDGARLEFHDATNQIVKGRIESLAPISKTRLFKVATVRLSKRLPALSIGDVGRWAFPAAAITGRGSKRLLKTHACDDLAAAAAALCAFDRIRKRRGMEHVGLLFTVAEEVGFVGAIGAATNGLVKKNARLVCLENSRSFPESPIGGGPIVRVGDRMTVFSPGLTNEISTLMMAHAAANPKFKWQRKLMAGGACEATAFSAFGFHSTCLCLPLGNYHNMQAIDEVQAGRRPAKVGREYISVEDLHGLVEMLEVVANGLDAPDKATPLPERLRTLRRKHEIVLNG